jgi:hypothetical protein
MNWAKIKYSMFLLLFLAIQTTNILAQRNYKPNSVLATGNWYKIATINEGIHKIDISFLTSLGLNTNNLSSNSIRLFSNSHFLPDEKNIVNRLDDLQELAIEVVDGGDGIFNANDYVLFYASSVDIWQNDSLNNRFIHQKNLFSDSLYYFLTIGGNGKRVTSKNTLLPATTTVTSFNERYFYEADKINFLNSGKEWFGDEFSNLPGNSINKNFNFSFLGLETSTPVHLSTNFAVRSIGTASNFNISVNNLLLPSINGGSVSGNYLDAFAVSVSQNYTFSANNHQVNLNFSFQPANSSAQGWLNWFELHCRRSLNMNNQSQFLFRDWQSVGINSVANFLVSGTNASTVIWDITHAFEPQKMASNFNQTQTGFTNEANRLKQYIAFNNTNFFNPIALGKIGNQNLHNSSSVNYLIISHPLFVNEAKRLATFHQVHYKYTTFVTTVNEIYNEFSGGIATPVAIRDFIKMYYDKAGTDTTKKPQYVLLLGAASFDYKNRISNNTNFVPAYQSVNSLDPLITYTSDDFFGLLDDADDVNLTSPPSLLDIAVGRLPVTNISEAKNTVDKIINYHAANTFGSWRNNTIFTADDKDGNVHLNDAELISNNAFATNQLFNQEKIYLDAYPLVSGSGGGRYPEVNNAIVNGIFKGALLFNYSGHGGYKRLADEAIFGQAEANQLNNASKLPLFITATCDFAPYDDPTKNALGTALLVGEKTGAIALVTTTRIVFAFSNRVLNNNFLKILCSKSSDNTYLTLGKSIQQAKNFTYQTFADVNNNRKFTLLGDPGIRLAFPILNMQLTAINNQTINGSDTLKALGKYSFTGRVLDAIGNTANNFNGTVYPVIFDKAQTIQTLGNDVASPIVNFSQQKNVLYKGKATVTNGIFNFSFIVPKDINYQFGAGRLSLYANNETTDANGISTNFLIGGTSNNVSIDNSGPTIRAFLNDEKFVNGGLVNEKPLLIVRLFDSSGINTVGSGIGHDITAILDGNEKNIIVLNNFYEADTNNFQSGQIKYQLPTLENGVHYLKIKVWDVANNSSEMIVEFLVQQKETLKISHVLNYPNPFTSKTSFWFEHNQPNSNLNVLINIFSVTGKLVHQIQKNVLTTGTIINDIEWDGKDRNSEKLGRGVYIYRIIVTNSEGLRAETTQKLYLL